MSLTSQLQNPASPVSQFMADAFPHPETIIRSWQAQLTGVTTLWPNLDTAAPRDLIDPEPRETPHASAPARRYARLTEVVAARARAHRAYPYSTIGTALDYRLRYYFAHTPASDLVAWQGAELVCPAGELDGPAIRRLGRWTDGPFSTEASRWSLPADVAATFFLGPAHGSGASRQRRRWRKRVTRAVVGGAPSKPTSPPHGLEPVVAWTRPVRRRLVHAQEELLNRYCVGLALFEQLFRAGEAGAARSPLFVPEPKGSFEEILAIPESHWLDDLCALSWAFHDTCAQTLLGAERITLNPTFAGSGAVGGADADLIVDGCLFDIKATIRPVVSPSWLYQLLGYVLLDYDDTYGIREVGLYLARQSTVLRWPLADFIDQIAGTHVSSLTTLRARFQHALHARAAARNRGRI